MAATAAKKLSEKDLAKAIERARVAHLENLVELDRAKAEAKDTEHRTKRAREHWDALEKERETRVKRVKREAEKEERKKTREAIEKGRWVAHGRVEAKYSDLRCADCDKPIRSDGACNAYRWEWPKTPARDAKEDPIFMCQECHKKITHEQPQKELRSVVRHNARVERIVKEVAEGKAWVWHGCKVEGGATLEDINRCSNDGECWYQGNRDRMDEWTGYYELKYLNEEGDYPRYCAICVDRVDADELAESVRAGQCDDWRNNADTDGEDDADGD